MNWKEIRTRFNEEKDLDEKVNILYAIINQRKVCKKQKCKPFEGIMLAQSILTYLDHTDLDSAKKKLGDNDFKHFKKNYFKIKELLDLTFAEVFSLSSTHDTVRDNDTRKHILWRGDVKLAVDERGKGNVLVHSLGSGLEGFLKATDPNQKYQDHEETEQEDPYTKEGIENANQLTKQFKSDLSGLKRKNGGVPE